MNFSVSTSPVLSQKQPAAILFAFEKERLDGPTAFKNLLRHVSPKEFRGTDRQLFLLHSAGKLAPQRVLLVGLGKRNKFAAETLRRAMGLAAKRLRDLGVERAAVQVTGDVEESLRAIVEAAILATYKFRQFKPADKDATDLKSLTLCVPAHTDVKTARKTVADAQIVAESTNDAREIGNLPGNVVTPRVLADLALAAAKEHGLKCTVLAKRNSPKPASADCWPSVAAAPTSRI